MEEGFSGFCIKAHGNVVRGNGNGGGTGTKCGRWNPTTEQVKVLTDLFRSGLRTPSTDQIQKISTQLSFYGKIESKNVFYWFQNHKARERQKRRKVSMDEHDFICSARSSDCNNISSSKRFFEVNDNNNNINNSNRHREHEVKAYEHERVIETLQLFPISSFDGNEHERVRFHAGECRETSSFSYTISAPEMDHPPLDLRLSFL